jgi:hypothetical protein
MGRASTGARRAGRLWPGRHGLAWAAAVTAVAVTAAGALTAASFLAAGPADADQHVTAREAENCSLAAPGAATAPGTAQDQGGPTLGAQTKSTPPGAGAQPVSVTMAARFPVSVAAGQPVQPADVRITVTLPPALVRQLAAGHAASLAASAALTVTATAGPQSATRTWSGLTAPASAVPAAGSLTLTAAGPVPAAPARLTAAGAGTGRAAATAGHVVFTAGGLTLTIARRTATANDAALPARTLTCGVIAGAAVTPLATVPVTGAARARRHPAAKPKHLYCPPPVGLPKPGPTGGYGCAYIEGYSDVRKLNGAALIGPGLLNLSVGVKTIQRSGFEKIYSYGWLLYKGKHELPPATATFLSFGFMPTSATMQLTDVGLTKVLDVLDFNDFNKSYTIAWSKMELRVYNVKVNGSSLAVGPHCQTVRPIRLTLHGDAKYSIDTGGVLAGFVTIPPFTGCGVGENLDPLFNGTISGPGNYVKITQGNLCTPKPNAFDCPAHKPRPQH